MMWVRYVSLNEFVICLAHGWRFPGDIAEPMSGGHGRFATLMEFGG